MDNTDFNCSSSSTGSNASKTLTTGSFYGKKLTCPKVQVKVTKLSASDIEYYLGKLPSKTESENKSKFSRPRRKILPVVGSVATRHNVKPLSARKRQIISSRNGKVKQNAKLGLMDDSEEECSNVRKNPRRKAAAHVSEKKYMDLSSDCSDDEVNEVTHKVRKSPRKKQPAQTSEEDCSDYEEVSRKEPAQTSEEDSSEEEEPKFKTKLRKTIIKPKYVFKTTKKDRWKLRRGIPLVHQVRKNPGRKAAAVVKKKIAEVFKDTDDEESSDSGSNFSSSDEDERLKKSKESTDSKENPIIIPEPEFSDYEKAAQEKLALHKEFLKSLKIHSL